MGHPDDDDKTVYLEYHRDEVKWRDARIAELDEKLKDAMARIWVLESQLAQAKGLDIEID